MAKKRKHPIIYSAYIPAPGCRDYQAAGKIRFATDPEAISEEYHAPDTRLRVAYVPTYYDEIRNTVISPSCQCRASPKPSQSYLESPDAYEARVLRWLVTGKVA